MHRRRFLQSAGLAVAGAAAPLVLPSRLFGAQAPSNRITLGFIGTGRQAQSLNLPEFMAVPGVEVVAVCDVDSWRVDQARTLVEGTYARTSTITTGSTEWCRGSHRGALRRGSRNQRLPGCRSCTRACRRAMILIYYTT